MQQEQQEMTDVVVGWISKGLMNISAWLAMAAGALNAPDLVSWVMTLAG